MSHQKTITLKRQVMKLFKFLKKAPEVNILDQEVTSNENTIETTVKPQPEALAQDSSEKEKKSNEIITITYGTGMPIDVIYGFIAHNYEQEGYQDALINTSVEYCTAKENIILNELNQLFRRILLRYRGEIRALDVQIENAKSLFALTSASQLSAHKETCEEHISEINEMIEKVNAKAPEMMTMIESYRRGFTKGCAAQTANFLNPNRITA